MTSFDNYEISPCTRTEEPDKPGHFYFEPCEPHEADVWTLYGHIPGEGAMAIGDFDSREQAEEAFQRITGILYGSHDEVEARVRVMHAGPRLLEALERFIYVIDHKDDHARRIKCAQAIELSREAVAEATSGKPCRLMSHQTEALLLASAYIQYVKERDPELHRKADGTPSIELAINLAFIEAEGMTA